MARSSLNPTRTAQATAGGRWNLWPGLSGYQRAWLGPDIIAGMTLAAVSIPECMGYTRIAGTPVVTGLYTILLPLLAFALLGSSRHLVVGADSATAAILYAGLTGMAQPNSAAWLALAGDCALLTAVFLVLASALRLGFVSNFLSRTVLVGFLSGVGVSLLVGQLPAMLGITVRGKGFLAELSGTVRGLPHTQGLTLSMALAVLAVILVCEKFARRVPGSLLAVALAIGATWLLRLDRHGLGVVGAVPPGLPALHLPGVSLTEGKRLLPIAASMFLVIVAQSAATARSFASKYSEPLDENRDLFALGAANALAGLSGTFVVNGSPTKTAVVDAAGGRTQVAQLTTVAATLAVLLCATSLIAHLPNAALAALVFCIGIKLIDLQTLRQIWSFRRTTFAVACAALLGVVLLGVERGIFLAIGLSVLDHLRQEYHPKDVVLVPREVTPGHAGKWQAAPANAGTESARGLLVYRFEAPLFFANADYFEARLQALITGAPHPVQWLVLDLAGISDVDFTAGLTFLKLVERWQRQHITIALAQCGDISDTLDRLGITAKIGAAHRFESISEAVDAYRDAGRHDDA